ncbi:MAG: hypothetical protein D6722_26915 [Bacteroidetes bacterium]|nr:MAG: hypothetical protein D6722_26915 [Bacteroidota bacterium]
MVRISFLLLACMSAFPSLSPAQSLVWKTELEAGMSFPLSAYPDGVGWHLGALRRAGEGPLWHRASLGLQYGSYSPFYLTPDQSPALEQDSGMVRRYLLSYGLVHRSLTNEHVIVNLGAELGGALIHDIRTTRGWEGGDITDDPAIDRTDTRSLALIVSPYAGLTIWLTPSVGMTTEGWLRTYFGVEQGFSLNMMPEARFGLVWRPQ